jgi:hypothetical protein
MAVLFYSLFPENAIVLPILGALFSIPCFWIIVTRVYSVLSSSPTTSSDTFFPATQPQYGPSSRFVLLTFNLTVHCVVLPPVLRR